MDSEKATTQETMRQATKKAMDFLARREHSRHELQRKLVTAGFDQEISEQAIVRLQSRGLVSDRRFAEAYIRYRVSRGQGPQRIRLELGEKGVRGALVEELMLLGEYNWRELAKKVREKKFGDERPIEFKERARQARFLQYRGFESDQVKQALDEI